MPSDAPITKPVAAAVLLIGDEILSGRTQDTNLQTIAKFVGPLGVQIGEVRVVSDVEELIAAAVNELLSRTDAFDPARASLFKTNVTEFTQRVGDLHLAGDLKNQARAERTLPTVLEAFVKVKACFPELVTASARQRADAFLRLIPLHDDTCQSGRRYQIFQFLLIWKSGVIVVHAKRTQNFSTGTLDRFRPATTHAMR